MAIMHIARPNQGFTLLEVMIALVIISIMSGLIGLNINASHYSTFMANANKVASTLSALADEAVYSDSVISCKVNNNGLDCSRYKNQTWQALPISKVVSWDWPDSIHVLQLSVGGVFLKEHERVIKFYPTGDSSPTSLQITDTVNKTWIDSSFTGGFVVNN